MQKRFSLKLGVPRGGGTPVVLAVADKASQLPDDSDIDGAEIETVAIYKNIRFDRTREIPQPVATSPVAAAGAWSGSPGSRVFTFAVDTTQAGATTRYTQGSNGGSTPADPTGASASVADNANLTATVAGVKFKLRTFGPAGYASSAVVSKTVPADV